MENRPHISINGRIIPSDIEDKFLKWYDEVYCPTYIKIPGNDGIDTYRIVKRSLEYPDLISIFHRRNRKAAEEYTTNPTRIAIQKDYNATFYRVQYIWHDLYALVGSFRNDSSSSDSSIVDNAPIIHLEGFKVPATEQGRYDQWFMKWASRVYIPILMKSPGLKAYNCFKASDLSIRTPWLKYLEVEIPAYVSILYFENMQSFENYEASLEYASFKRHMEVELPSSMSTIWNVQYQLRKSWRK
ncbi:MAG: hypothetical protein V1894_05390 [Chloroflexota bacterium]